MALRETFLGVMLKEMFQEYECNVCIVCVCVSFSFGLWIVLTNFIWILSPNTNQQIKMAMAMQNKRANIRLPPEVNRILYVRNLPYKITSDEMYDIFGKYGAIRQIRVGNTPETRGTAFVVYEDIFDAKNACDHLQGFNVCNRYLVVLYYQPSKAFKKVDIAKKEAEIDHIKKSYNL